MIIWVFSRHLKIMWVLEIKSSTVLVLRLTVLLHLHVLIQTCENNVHLSIKSVCYAVSQYSLLKTGGFCWNKALLPACPCWWQLVHLSYGEDARILLNGVTCYLHHLNTFILHFSIKSVYYAVCMGHTSHCLLTFKTSIPYQYHDVWLMLYSYCIFSHCCEIC